jgi:hypothetical protein
MNARSALRVALLCGVLTLTVAAPAAAQDPPADAPATQLRMAIDRVLAEHAFLSIQVMRTGLSGGEAFAAAGDALDENTDELVAAIDSIYGREAADVVDQQWRNHIAYIVDYARALDDNDTSAATLADSQLQKYVADFSAVLSGTAHLPEEVVSGLINEHVEQLQQVASFEGAQFGEAYPAIRETYEHMFMIGDRLALAIVAEFPDRFTGRNFAFSRATDLRLDLNRLLGEHTELAALAMRASLTDAPDAAAASAALEANTAELQAAIATIYGEAAGTAFGTRWRNHTDLYLDYVAATKASNSTAQAAALRGLRSYRSTFTAFLVKANPLLSAAEFEDLIAEHTNQLVEEADLFAEGDFAGAYAAGREAFAHSGVLGDYLARAIADQFPDLFPNTANRKDGSDLRLAGVLLSLLAVLAWIWTSSWEPARGAARRRVSGRLPRA